MQSLNPLPNQGEQSFSFEVVRVNPQGEVLHQGQGSAPCRRLDLGRGLSQELVWVPGGIFTMGSPAHEPPLGEGAEYYRDLFNAERPQHGVTVAEFWLGKYSVTQAQYGAVMGQNPSQFKGHDRLVEQVRWDEAMAFCDRLSDLTGQTCTLPSEAQWEYACRAGSTTPFHCGETIITTALANYNGHQAYGAGPSGIYRQGTTPVGSFPPNPFGLYDMHGNVWEWCLDPFHETYEGAPSDDHPWTQRGDPFYRTIRGGSWYCYAPFCRSAHREQELHRVHLSNFGFRVVGV